MAKSIMHMGMNLTTEQDEKWHKEHKDITPKQHKEFMHAMGIHSEVDL